MNDIISQHLLVLSVKILLTHRVHQLLHPLYHAHPSSLISLSPSLSTLSSASLCRCIDTVCEIRIHPPTRCQPSILWDECTSCWNQLAVLLSVTATPKTDSLLCTLSLPLSISHFSALQLCSRCVSHSSRRHRWPLCVCVCCE